MKNMNVIHFPQLRMIFPEGFINLSFLVKIADME